MIDTLYFSRHLAVSALAVLASSCGPSDEYDTPPPYQPAGSGYQAYGSGQSDSGTIYDSQPAYGDGSSPETQAPRRPVGPSPGLPEDPGAGGYAPSAPPVTTPSTPSRPATVHTVVKGDTLSGISSQYGVGIGAIKRANNMTIDIVVLGKKLIIPSP